MVEKFQKKVLITAAVVFLIVMIIIAIIMKKSMLNTKFPPEVSSCPDYYDAERLENGNVRCISKFPRLIGKPGLKTGSKSYINFDYNPSSVGSSSDNVEKCKWANNFSLTWDGYTNADYC